MKKNLLLSAIVMLVCLLLGEVALRMWHERPGFSNFPEDQPAGLYVAHPIRYYEMAPNFDSVIDAELYNIQVSTNALGLRDDPVQPGETIDILAVGDSFTEGFGVEAEQAWPSQLEAALNSKRGARRPLRVLNGAVSAYSLIQIRNSIEELLNLKPRMIIVGLYMRAYWRIETPYIFHKGYVVTQDSTPYFDVIEDGFVQTGFENRIMQRLHLWTLKHYYTGAIALDTAKFLLEDKEEPESKSSRSSEARLAPLLKELEQIRQLCERANTPIVVMLVNHQSRNGSFGNREREYNAVVSSFCRQAGIQLFNPLPIFSRKARGKSAFRIGSNSHWSQQAHRVAGRELAGFLMSQDGIRELLNDEESTTP